MTSEHTSSCPFCAVLSEPGKILFQNPLAYVINNITPITPGHFLIIPVDHGVGYCDLSEQQILAVHNLLKQQKESLCAVDPFITGFNIGVNDGASAGQTIFGHAHLHVVPRRDGDVSPENLRGGIMRALKNVLNP